MPLNLGNNHFFKYGRNLPNNMLFGLNNIPDLLFILFSIPLFIRPSPPIISSSSILGSELKLDFLETLLTKSLNLRCSQTTVYFSQKK